ncbi:hypothetical protein DPMN_049380 [Dreissena polymorpha]|uniref:Uncharacterized protein n=1 Tax=Dreissena polymorpha TaxID=45954 RepID=A0A9D4CE95_DREPO|nr:hypothetical protein DPMN_049380 [Dreissena polymorpha]
MFPSKVSLSTRHWCGVLLFIAHFEGGETLAYGKHGRMSNVKDGNTCVWITQTYG